MVLGRLLWKGVKHVGKKLAAHARAHNAAERRKEALNAQVRGRAQPEKTYPSFGQAYENILVVEENRRINACWRARDLARESSFMVLNCSLMCS